MLWNVGCAAGGLLLAQMVAAQVPAPAVGARYAITATAVSAALAEAGLPVTEARLHLPGAVTAHADGASLKITAAEQRANGSLDVRFACRKTVDCMPFFVAIDAGGDPAAMAAFAAQKWAAHEAAPAAGAGIATGARVTLQLTDTQMRIQLPAVAIDTGVPGAEVRVASLDRKHTWRGVVVDAATVRGGVQ